MPALIQIDDFAPEVGSEVFLLGHDKPLTWTPNGTGFTISIPSALRQNPPGKYAHAFKIKAKI
jgi:alpha-L-fucosidase